MSSPEKLPVVTSDASDGPGRSRSMRRQGGAAGNGGSAEEDEEWRP